jgi:NAD+ kinase
MSGNPRRDLVGLVGGSDEAEAAVEAAGGRTVSGEVGAVLDADPDAVVAVGDAALCGLAARPAAAAVPILPVAAGTGVRSVPAEDLTVAVETLLAGEDESHAYPVVAATTADSELARGLFELLLVTAEPARISEYAVTGGPVTVARFRADGVVVATPAGSHEYARAVGSPVIARGSDVLAVTPIAPFTTDDDHWVLPTGSVALTVERDESAVELLADDRSVGQVTPGERLTVEQVDTVTLLTVPASRSPYTRPRGRD